MSYINKIRERLKVSTLKRGSDGVDNNVHDLPVDHQVRSLDSRFTFQRHSDEEWQYVDGAICVNGNDVEGLLEYEARDVRLWCGVSEGLTEYKEHVSESNRRAKNDLLSKIDSVQGKVLCNMKKLYDEKTEGIYLSLGDGELLFNNFNVRAFLAMYHVRPTEKARRFLVGLKSKLALILVNKNGTPQYERVHRVIQQLYEEVVYALGVPPIETRCLPSSFRHRSL